VVTAAADEAGLTHVPDCSPPGSPDSPDLLVLGPDVPLADALQCVRSLPGVRCVLLAETPDTDGVVAAIGAGARGYLPADIGTHGLARALADVLAGQVAVPRALGGSALRSVVGPMGPDAASTGTGLTRREMTVADLLVAGMTDREIADTLTLSTRTVHSHVTSIRRKLGARNRTEAVTRYQAARRRSGS